MGPCWRRWAAVLPLNGWKRPEYRVTGHSNDHILSGRFGKSSRALEALRFGGDHFWFRLQACVLFSLAAWAGARCLLTVGSAHDPSGVHVLTLIPPHCVSAMGGAVDVKSGPRCMKPCRMGCWDPSGGVLVTAWLSMSLSLRQYQFIPAKCLDRRLCCLSVECRVEVYRLGSYQEESSRYR